MLKTHALAFLALSCASSTLAAQEPPAFTTPLVDPDFDVIEWPTGLQWHNEPWSSFGRWVAGNLTTVPGGDAIGLREGSLYLMEGFQFIDSLVPFDTLTSMDLGEFVIVHDVAVLEGAGRNGRAAILTRDSVNGLAAHLFIPPDSSNAGFFYSTVIDSGAAWKNEGSLLVHGDLIVGSRLKKLRSYTYDPGTTTYTAGPTVVFGNKIEEFTLGDFDGDQVIDLAASTEVEEVEIRPADGSPGVTSFSMAVDAMTHVPNPAGGELLVLAYDSNLEQWLQTRTTSTIKQDLRLEVAPTENSTAVDLEVYALLPGDYVEGREGLIVAHQSFAQSVVLLRDPGTLNYDVNDIQRVAFESVAGTVEVLENVGIPAFWSDDLYGRNVIVYPADSLNGVARTTSPEIVHHEAGMGNGGNIMRKCTFSDDPSLTVHFKVPNMATLSGYNYAKVIVYRQDVEGEEVSPEAIHYWFPLPQQMPGHRRLKATLSMDTSHWETPAHTAWSPNGPVFWTSVSLLKVDEPVPGNLIVNNEAWTNVFGWRVNDDPGDAYSDYWSYLVNLPYYLTALEVFHDGEGGPDNPGFTFGMMGMSTRMADFESEPQVPLPTIGDTALSD